jgi:glycerophosphoryl diester phosphodiesterase
VSDTPAAALALPRVIGHRGAAALAPENTLASLRAAHDAGARWVEFDVRLSADGIPVLIHDPTLRRIAACEARVAALSAAELAATDAGAWFSPAFAGEGIPSLAEALALCARLGLGANIEMKWCGARSPALARAVAARIGETRRAGAALPLLVSSFRPALMHALLAADPAIPRGLLMGRPGTAWHARVRGIGASAIVCGAGSLTPARTADLKKTGLPLVAYTVNDPELAARLYRQGVDAVVTDDPAALLAAG